MAVLLQDPEEGVNYFKNTLKKFFLKGLANVCLSDFSVSSITEGRTPSSHRQSRSTQAVPQRHADKTQGRISPPQQSHCAVFIIQSELSDQQRERLISAMSLRNISLENYSYEMMKTQYHDLFITMDEALQPQGFDLRGAPKVRIRVPSQQDWRC